MGLSALDENGRPVDWWFVYKVPKLGAGLNNDAATGYEYAYYDSSMDGAGKPVQKSLFVINQGKGALNETLDAIFVNNPPDTVGWILYNDEFPDDEKKSDDGNLGHTKGVIAFDTATNTAVWLLHSWPKFADISAINTMKDPTPMYGQTYICLTLDLNTVRKIAEQMANHQEPQTYSCRTANLPKDDPLYRLSLALNPIQDDADSSVLELTTLGGMAFKVIAKNRNWNQDFWNGLVGPTLKEDLDVETWIRGEIPPIADTDGIHKTFDIKYVNLGALGVHWAWPETHDHSKWAITIKNNWVCVGDINRMVSQRKRGGGTIAFQNLTLWNALTKTSFLLAPPGTSRTQAHALIKTTHPPHTLVAPKLAKASQTKAPMKKEPKPAATKKAAPNRAAPKKFSKK